MAQISYYWGGTITGDATEAPYSDDEFSDIWRKLFTRDRTYQGVIGGGLNELEVTNPAGNTARVASGRALVDGKFYENDASVDFAIPNGAYSLVVRKTWATQQVRLAMIGPAGVGYPALTQVDGVTWEIRLADISAAAGAITSVYDRRRFIMRGPARRILVPVRDAADGVGRSAWDDDGWRMADNQITSVWAEWFVPNDYYANLTVNPLIVPNAASTGNIYLTQWVVLYGPWQMALCNSQTWADFNNVAMAGLPAVHALGVAGAIICGPELDLGTPDFVRPNDYMHFHMTRDATHVNDTLNDHCYIQGFMLEYDSIS